MIPKHILLIDIDGLRADVFQAALEAGRIPNLARLLGATADGFTRGIQIPVLSSAPSITFCAQACLFTGSHPKDHSIPGNQFFDRFGTSSKGVPCHFAFDVGETLAVDDAVRVFTSGLAANRLLVPTFYEKMATRGYTSVVAGNMYGKGADSWLKPSLLKLGRFVKGGNLFGMESLEYDTHVLEKLLTYLEENGLPNITTMYFLGLDHDSHKYGPDKAQLASLTNNIDPLIGRLWEAMQAHLDADDSIFVAIFSDHGQRGVIPDDEHSLRIGFPFDREMGYLFDALGLDVHDYPGEDPHCDAVLTLNGALADVYLQNRTGHWREVPDFKRDVLPVGRAFWEATQTGKYAPDLKNSLSGLLIRNVEQDGWRAPYQALTAEGEIISLEAWFAMQPAGLYADPVNRLNNLVGLFSGDLLLMSNYDERYYFGNEISGLHGGLHPEDSHALLAYGWPAASATEWQSSKSAITTAIQSRCQAENGRHASIVDMLTGVEALL
jgi:hypothetical protein